MGNRPFKLIRDNYPSYITWERECENLFEILTFYPCGLPTYNLCYWIMKNDGTKECIANYIGGDLAKRLGETAYEQMQANNFAFTI